MNGAFTMEPSTGENKIPVSARDSAVAAASVTPQGRRVTIGGMNRRSSLGVTEAILGETLARRSSGFGELGDFSGTMMGRRGSLDSTSAVLDAAIMDLTRRRLSVMGGADPMGALADPLAGMSALGSMDPAFSMGMGNMGMSSMAGMGMGMGMGIGAAPGGLSLGNPSAVAAAAAVMRRESLGGINSRQKQIEDQRRDLERRQKELEVQSQQLVTAMDERRRVMSEMQTKMGVNSTTTPASAAASAAASTASRRGSLSSLTGMGLTQPQAVAALAASTSAPNAAATAAVAAAGSNRSESGWYVCKICNSKAFANREEAMQHEALCAANTMARRGSLGGIGAVRRSSLDLLMNTLDHPTVASMREQQQRHSLGLGALAERRFSLTGNYEADHAGSAPSLPMSTGPFAPMENPISLSMPSDKDWLTPLHCFVRRHCVQVFTATDKDVSTPSKGKRKPIQVGQVGIRCPHCHQDETCDKARERGSIYYPTSIASIYNATMNLLQRHLHSCSSVPLDIMRRYETLKADDARSGTSKKYWMESALSLGLVDTSTGIRFSALPPPALPSLSRQQHSTGAYSVARRNSNDFFSNHSNAVADMVNNVGGVGAAGAPDEGNEAVAKANAQARKDGNQTQQASEAASAASAPSAHGKGPVVESGQSMSQVSPLVSTEDEPYATGFSYHLLSQMQPCVFTEADRLGKRKGLPPGFPGLACRHCFGGYGSGRFFPSSIKTLSDTSKTLNVLHNHMMRCRKCPPEVRESLDKLRKSHDQERSKMKFGSQKAFFARIWDRLHYKDPTVNSKRKFQPNLAPSRAVPPASVSAMLGGVPGHGAVFPWQAQHLSASAIDALAMQNFGGLLDPTKRRKL